MDGYGKRSLWKMKTMTKNQYQKVTELGLKIMDRSRLSFRNERFILVLICFQIGSKKNNVCIYTNKKDMF